MVLTQTPVHAEPQADGTLLDLRYPPGSRVILAFAPFDRNSVRDLSRGLVAAGDPCVSWDGSWVYFAGKGSAGDDWQIYRVDAGGGEPERVTRMPGGAMDPAIAAHGELVFSSPVPRAGRVQAPPGPASLYGKLPGQEPVRLTFGVDGAEGATVLRDGRILYIGARDNERTARNQRLFTINNDGTEVTLYACDGDGANFIRRPRELGDGRVAFLSARTEGPDSRALAEFVNSAAPFETRGALFAFRADGIRSVEPAKGGEILACIETGSSLGRSMETNAKVYRFASGAAAPGTPLFDDPERNNFEATPVAARTEPSGHTTAIMPGATYGTLLCLNVDASSQPAADGNLAPAAELRVLVSSGSGEPRILGTVPVEADGSVIVRLPSNVALGLETLDARGNVLRHQPASLWLRPGENRACVGCHEPHNHAPRNIRPLATTHIPAHLELGGLQSAPKPATP